MNNFREVIHLDGFFVWNVFQINTKNQVLLEYIPNKSKTKIKRLIINAFVAKITNLF